MIKGVRFVIQRVILVKIPRLDNFIDIIWEVRFRMKFILMSRRLSLGFLTGGICILPGRRIKILISRGIIILEMVNFRQYLVQ